MVVVTEAVGKGTLFVGMTFWCVFCVGVAGMRKASVVVKEARRKARVRRRKVACCLTPAIMLWDMLVLLDPTG